MQKQKPKQTSSQSGQSMVEYALIVALVILSFAVAIAATGPAIGNVFSNTVYNLLGTNPDELDDLPDKEAFWLTVTWVSQQTPVEEPLPTRTRIPPTEQPTDGPSPTPTDTATYTPTVPTNTPTPSPTPEDFEFEAPWHDSADEDEHWRLGGDLFLGTDPGWYVKFYPNTTLSSSPTIGQYTSEIDPDKQYDLDFNWGGGSPISGWPAGDPGDDFSASFRRHIYLDEASLTDVELLFKMEFIDDGYRVWLLDGHVNLETTDPDDCSSTGITWGGNPDSSGDPDIYEGTNDCLIIDAWGNHYNDAATAKRTVPAGAYTVVVDMVEFGGGAGIRFSIDSTTFPANADDTPVDSSGNPSSGNADCRWGNEEDSRDSNSEDFRWDSWESGDDFGIGNRCYLELRGSVLIPPGMTDPILTFWDIWDFRDPSMNAWVEVSEYDANGDFVFDRSELDWKRQDLHTGNSTNYNWTYQRIDLKTLMGITGTETMENKRYTIRFGMEVPEASYATGNNRGYRMWWIDTIKINTNEQDVFYPAKFWDMEDPSHVDDFIASGRWAVTGAKPRGGTGFSWEDSQFSDYQKTNLDGCGATGSGCSDYDDQNLRMHTLEFDGIIDFNDPRGAVDLEGDGGDIILSFWHTYDIDQRTGLEIQYTTDLDYDAGEAPEWKLVPSGQINSRDNDSRPSEPSHIFTEVNLQELEDLEPAANGRFRIRFAMTVGRNSNTDPGWWIDDIKLERLAISNFLPYPYLEDFEQVETLNDWLLGGTWNRVDNRAYRPISATGHSLTDSPYTLDTNGDPQQETYNTNTTSTVEIRLAFDVNNDSPDNPFSPSCALLPSNLCDDPDNDLPVDPILTFQWWHDFENDSGVHFYVDWRKADASDPTWKELWTYQDSMTYQSSSNNSDTRRQFNWQRVEVDLRQIWASPSFENSLPDSVHDDDILFRFRFEVGSRNGGDGVYVDEIRLEERNEKVHALWDEGAGQDVENPTFPSNDPLIYTTGGFRYVRFETLSEVNGREYATIAELNLLDKDGNLIDRSDWEIEDYSSQRNTSSYQIGNLIDGDDNTAWFSDLSENHPHWIEIDLDASNDGDTYQVGFFTHLPRQIDTSNSWYQNGWIREFEFYVSNDGNNWELAKAGQLERQKSEQTVALQIDYTTDTAPPSGSGTETVIGDGVSYRDNLDDRANEIFDNWYLGGNWNVIEWAQYDGVLAFHDSTNVPLNSTDPPETLPPDFSNITKSAGRSYNVLEMATIIDMRATPASSRPIMTFWQRHDIGNEASIRVQVAYEDASTIGDADFCRSPSRDQCYDHLYGWSEWQTIPPWNLSGYSDWDKTGTVKQFLWKREIFDLSSFAATADESGKRIRIRFVSETMDANINDNSLRDGWYIDNLEISFYNPSVQNIDADSGDVFFDGARNTRNWIMEGTWGLSPEFFRGSGGGVADFGGAAWTYDIYDFYSNCSSGNTGYPNCVKGRFDSWDDPDDGAAYRVRQGTVLDISNDWGRNGPGSVSDKFAGIWELTTPIIGTTMQAGNYTFVFTYNEGLRVKYDTIPAGNLPSTPDLPNPYNPEWNIFNDFNVGSRQVGVGNALFQNGEQYKLRLEFFERWDDATLILSLGSSSFSFTDSPKQAAGAAFPEVPAAPRAESSMIFRGVFDLSDAIAPIMRYYTYYELDGNSTARVEVTQDGGFIWTQTGLDSAVPVDFWTSNWDVDLWDDGGRDRNQKMAYRDAIEAGGQPDYNLTVYPPDVTLTDWASNDFNVNWGGGRPVSGFANDDWSGQFRRSFTLPEPTEVRIRITADDGFRLWLNANGSGYFPGCYFLDGDSNKPIFSGAPRVSGENNEVFDDPATHCLLLSDWVDGGNNNLTVTRTIPAGNHEFVLDYYENGGGAKLRFEMWVGGFDGPNYRGTFMPPNEWQERVHSLSSFAGNEIDGDPKPPIGLRFRLDRLGENENSNYQQDTNQSPTNWMESWWITDISILDTKTGTP